MECACCREEVKQLVVTRPCDHHVCGRCTEDALTSTGKCPICERPFHSAVPSDKRPIASICPAPNLDAAQTVVRECMSRHASTVVAVRKAWHDRLDRILDNLQETVHVRLNEALVTAREKDMQAAGLYNQMTYGLISSASFFAPAQMHLPSMPVYGSDGISYEMVTAHRTTASSEWVHINTQWKRDVHRVLGGQRYIAIFYCSEGIIVDPLARDGVWAFTCHEHMAEDKYAEWTADNELHIYSRSHDYVLRIDNGKLETQVVPGSLPSRSLHAFCSKSLRVIYSTRTADDYILLDTATHEGLWLRRYDSDKFTTNGLYIQVDRCNVRVVRDVSVEGWSNNPNIPNVQPCGTDMNIYGELFDANNNLFVAIGQEEYNNHHVMLQQLQPRVNISSIQMKLQPYPITFHAIVLTGSNVLSVVYTNLERKVMFRSIQF